MDLLQDSSQTMGGLNARLKGFLEQVNRLQEANRRLEAQIADRGVRNTSRSQDWSQQEQTVKELRAQVRLLYIVIYSEEVTCEVQLGILETLFSSRRAAELPQYYFMLRYCSFASAQGRLGRCV